MCHVQMRPPGPEIVIKSARQEEDQCVVFGSTLGKAACPDCGRVSATPHGNRVRRLQDLPLQGLPTTIEVRLRRWRCQNPDCKRLTFSDPLSNVAEPRVRRTRRAAEVSLTLAHAAGGRAAERLLHQLGLPQSDATVLRALRRRAGEHGVERARVVGIDDWSTLKGERYGTILVDLERRRPIDLLADRSAETTSRWFAQHPEVRLICRDRCGLYAKGARESAPQAPQVADRFHLIENLRLSIQRQLSRALEAPSADEPALPIPLTDAPNPPMGRSPIPGVLEHMARGRQGRRSSWSSRFDQVKAMQLEGGTITEAAQTVGCNWRTAAKWFELEILPERQKMAPKLTSPEYFQDHLSRRWREGVTHSRRLLSEIKELGYQGSLSHLQRLLSWWRKAHVLSTFGLNTAMIDAEIARPPAHPIVAAALCIKPRHLMTAEQRLKADQWKATWPGFAVMRRLAMRFRGLLRGGSPEDLEAWLKTADTSGIHAMGRFATTLRLDLEAVQNAMKEVWSNGQTEGQINRLKTLKRAMYGRANHDLLKARLLPLPSSHNDHTK